MKKIILSAAMLMAFASVSFAGTPETKSPSETKSKDATTYYVVGQTTDQTKYLLSTSPAPGCLPTGSFPCEILSDVPLSSPIDKAEVDSSPDVEIITHRNSL